jgi:O-antigen/teichoic acid export membrane protein
MLAAFYLSPFVVHKLGDSAYGVWTLLMSLTGYLGLVDLGVRASTGRFINYYVGRGEQKRANEILSTSLVIYCAAGIVILGVAVVVGNHLAVWFPRLPAAFLEPARYLFPLLSLNIVLALFGATFTQLLVVRERFDLRAANDIAIVVLRTIATIIVLRLGYGITGLGIVTVSASFLACILGYLLARPGKHGFACHIGDVRSTTVFEILTFGGWSLISIASSRIINYTDTTVVAYLFGAEAVTAYAIGLTLIEYANNLLSETAMVFAPGITKTAGRGDYADLRELAIETSRRTAFLSIPLLVGVAVFASDFLRLWMGPAYASCSRITIILAVAHLGSWLTRSCQTTLWGMGRVRLLGLLNIIQAAANLGLSVLLAQVTTLGITAVAVGTLIPMVFLDWLVLPYCACRTLELPFPVYFRKTVLRCLPVIAIFSVISFIILDTGLGQGWIGLLAKVAIACALYLAFAPIFIFGINPLASLPAFWGMISKGTAAGQGTGRAGAAFHRLRGEIPNVKADSVAGLNISNKPEVSKDR